MEISLVFKEDTNIVSGNRYAVPIGFKYLKQPETPSAESFRIIKISPEQGKAGEKVRIEANQGVMDKVEQVLFGENSVSVKKENLKDDNRAIEIPLPELAPKDKAAAKVKISLVFKEGTDIVSGNRYAVPGEFKYLK